MGTYRPLFSVTVEHAYFPAQICKTLRFAATDACSALLQKAGLLLRCSESGIAVYFDEGKTDFLRLHAQDDMILTFKVFSADSNFFRYTAPGAPPDNAILYFDNRRITRDDSGKRLLHADSNVTQNAWIDMTADPLPEILERKDYLVKPAFVVQIAVTADAQVLYPLCRQSDFLELLYSRRFVETAYLYCGFGQRGAIQAHRQYSAAGTPRSGAIAIFRRVVAAGAAALPLAAKRIRNHGR